jgi:hypothetical protein
LNTPDFDLTEDSEPTSRLLHDAASVRTPLELDRLEPQLTLERPSAPGRQDRETALRDLPLYPLLRRVLAEHKLASPWMADDHPVFAAGRGKAKGYRNASGRSARP